MATAWLSTRTATTTKQGLPGGHLHSEKISFRERFTRIDFGHMDLELTFDDPKYYTRPFTLKTQLNLIPDSDVLEYVCTENEKDQAHTGKP